LFAVREEGDIPATVAIAVPKRLFKRAVDRNLLKRRIREAYRKHKMLFYSRLEEKNLKLMLVIQYQHKEILDYSTIETGLLKGLEKMQRELESKDRDSLNNRTPPQSNR
jgi:ribonuclease P protein component